jgi:hypothetical protein
MKVGGALASVMAIAILAGCGGPSATSTAASPTPTPTPTPADVAGAERSALGLFLIDPTAPNHWVACSNSDSWAACPLTGPVKDRLAALTSSGFFGDAGGCGEEYISGTQNGLPSPPQVVSEHMEADGSVSVVIKREASRPNLTAVMSLEGDAWLASDLASGTGPAASIFSSKPNC